MHRRSRAVQLTAIRCTSAESPECGPAPVTTVPSTTSTAVTATRTQAVAPADRPTGRAAADWRARCQVSVVVVSSAIASRKWNATT